MIREFVRFEIRYHLQRVSTYVYFAIWFFASFLVMAIPVGGGAQLVDSPLALARHTTEFSSFGVIVISAICGMAVCRDFELDVYPLIFTRPVRRRDYLAGRWLGSLVVCALVFTSIPTGLFAGTWMPWVDRAYRMPFAVWPFVQPYLVIILTTIFAAGTLFFAVGALTRRVSVVYLQGVLFLGAYLVSRQFLQGNLNDYWPAVVDAFGMTTVNQVTKYWTIVERNSQVVPLAGVLLTNRLLWCGVGALAAMAVFRYFPFSAEALLARRRKSVEVAALEPAAIRQRLPVGRPRFGWTATAAQFRTLTRLRVRTVVTDFVFLALVVVAVVNQIARVWGQPYVQDMPVYPVTYLMMRDAGGLIAIVITAIYAGEFVWRDRQIRFDQVHDALPARTWLTVASQFAALALVQAALLGADMLTGIVTQAIHGYYRFELGLYFRDIFILQYAVLLQFAALALFVQTVSPSKFLGHVIVIAIFLAPSVVLTPLAERLHLDVPTDLWVYGGRTTPYFYSDMNGYGPYVTSLAWLTTYWSAWAALLIVGVVLTARRGTDPGWWRRMRLAPRAARPPLLVAGSLLVVAAVATGGWVYYNDRVLNADSALPRWVSEARRARYEREYKQYEGIAQPKVIAVETRVEIYPRQGTAAATGTLTLQNKTGELIATLHVLGDDELADLSFDRAAALAKADEDIGYWIYTLESPLAPGETMSVTFASERTNPGFLIDPATDIVANGTFFNNGFMPQVGYQRRRELSDPRARARMGLGEREELPDPGAEGARMNSSFFSDADWVSYRAIVGTDEDQIAITPGYLVRDWTESGRRYFEYDLSDVPTAKFFSYLSGRYEVKRELWNGVSIEVYYHPVHAYNVDRMIAAAKAGLEYFSAAFGPYQFRQFRVIEFPRYNDGAQSFANTVSYSEAAGFIANPTGDEDLDSPFYITLHELAHQWWGHQLVGAAVQGSNMLSESLAEYSALMATEKQYGPDAVRLYLRHDLDRYLGGRANELRRELTLGRSSAPYVLYRKGSLALYALKDYLGEDVVNGALRRLLERYRMADPPYPTADDLIAELRAVTPDDLQYLITDLFETITLYDNRALEAAWSRRDDGKYVVTLKVQSGKVRADGQGTETPTPMNDLIDIGVFTGRGRQERALYLEKHRLTGGESTLEIVVDEQPASAGIDPYNKLIDRVSGDNVVTVTSG